MNFHDGFRGNILVENIRSDNGIISCFPVMGAMICVLQVKLKMILGEDPKHI